jgi:ankyrin repeat protein
MEVNPIEAFGRQLLEFSSRGLTAEVDYLLKSLKGNEELLAILHFRNAKDGNTCLHAVSEYGHIHTLLLLLNAGVDVNLQNHLGETPLHLATRQGMSSLSVYFFQKKSTCSSLSL